MTLAPPDVRKRGRPRKDEPRAEDAPYSQYSTISIEREEHERLHNFYVAASNYDEKPTPLNAKEVLLAKLRLDVFYTGERKTDEHKAREKEIEAYYVKLLKQEKKPCLS